MRRLLWWLALCASCAAPHTSQAQAYPSKPIRLITEFLAGSGGDTLLKSAGIEPTE